jgi:hypothetical protein
MGIPKQWPTEHSRSQCVMVRFTPLEYATVMDAAVESGMTITEYVRTNGTASLDLPERVRLTYATAGAATP